MSITPVRFRALYPSNGTAKWVRAEEADVEGAPAYANGLLVVGGGDELQVLNASTGALLWNFSSSNLFVAAPAVAGGVIYVGCTDGRVYAFGLQHPPPAFGVTFPETGLPSGTDWGATFAGMAQSTKSTSLSFEEVNGSWSYAISAPAGYVASPGGGVVRLAGASMTIPIRFTSLAPATFAVAFTETGLPGGTEWWVNVSGGPSQGTSTPSTQTTLSFLEPNGTYSFTTQAGGPYSATPASGSFEVQGGPVVETVAFTEALTHTIQFLESGLTPGASWSVELGENSQSSTTSSITFSEVDGSYGFAVTAAGFVPSPPSGSVTVQGANVTRTVGFTPAVPGTYPVTFSESGLPLGASWSVTLAGSPKTSTGTELNFSEPDGGYSFTVAAVVGFTADPTTGSVTVSGLPVSFSIAFTPSSPAPKTSSGSTLLGLPSWEGYALLGGILALVLVGSVVALLFRRRTKSSPGSHPPRQEGPP